MVGGGGGGGERDPGDKKQIKHVRQNLRMC